DQSTSSAAALSPPLQHSERLVERINVLREQNRLNDYEQLLDERGKQLNAYIASENAQWKQRIESLEAEVDRLTTQLENERN
ncbi:hypothetical protein AAVH_35303, partial [Aphelenchoides avenae]